MAAAGWTNYLSSMPAPYRAVMLGLAAAIALAMADPAAAARRKARPKAPPAPLVTVDPDGTPIIMRGYRPAPRRIGPADIMREEPGARRAARPLPARGSSTYIPPPVPSPNGPNSPPAASALSPGPGVYTPPRIDSFGDRATRCLHSFPLAGGVGNNPTDRDSYVRGCAN